MLENYRLFLKEVYISRKTKNPQYSLSAFSRDAGFKSYHMNDVLSGRYGLSPKRAKIVAEKLRLSSERKELFLALVDLDYTKSPIEQKIAMDRLKVLQMSAEKTLSSKDYPKLGEWYYLAAFELFKQNSKQINTETLMKALKITKEQAESALSEIKKLPNIENGILSVQAPDKAASDVIRHFHKQMIEKSLQSMETDPVEERMFTSFNMNLTKEDYSNLCNEVRAFIRKKIQHYQESPTGNERLYALNLQLFPLEQK